MADVVIVATGTAPSRPPSVPFEDGVVVDSNGLTSLKELPKSLIVVGTGVIGTEYASMLALLRIQVTPRRSETGDPGFLSIRKSPKP